MTRIPKEDMDEWAEEVIETAVSELRGDTHPATVAHRILESYGEELAAQGLTEDLADHATDMTYSAHEASTELRREIEGRTS